MTDKNINNFWKKVVISANKNYNGSPCWEWNGATKMEGGAVRINNKTYNAHRISWMMKNGDIEDDLYVLHKCDNRPCVNPDHLFLGTQKDNLNDMIQKGRRTNRKVDRKLTDKDVSEIRSMYNSGEYSQPKIAKVYEISTSHVCNIVNFKTWK